MGITVAPPDHNRRPLRVAGVAGSMATALAVTALVTFAVTGLLGVGGAWLVVALGEALLSLVLLAFPS
jgi:hypothetical protein